MAERFTRRGVLAGMTFAAADLLFSRELSAAVQDVPAIGNSHLLTLTAVSKKTLRLRVIQQGKQGPANETGIVPRPWPEPLREDANGFIAWGEYKVRMEDRPWQITITDSADKVRQHLRLDPLSGAIYFNLGDGPIFGLGEGGHPLNRRGTTDAMRNGQISPDLATYG
ncbi:MAG: hypothetical protein QOJ51_1098, partial [Acidobacteriaceae bacterium]|nr:hypothetical protein [Acidobacteriaceae bacterium]